MGKEHKEYTWSLVAKKLAGEATPAELKELEELLRNNPDLHYPLQTISDLWRHVSPGDKVQAEKAFSDHLDRMADLKIEYTHDAAGLPWEEDEDQRPRKWFRRTRTAAIFITPAIGLTIGLAWYLNRTPHPAAVAVVRKTPTVAASTGSGIFTANGSRTNLHLPDGTQVWLNAGSRLDYARNYGSVSREVNLTGEAFFDVAPNASKPFVIHTRRIDIRVLGTSFNVKSYPSDKTTEATLVKGSIEVSIRNRPSDKIILKPNEKLVVSNDDSLMKIPSPRRRALRTEPSLIVIGKPTYEEHTGAMIETSWIDNKLIFQDEVFSDLAKQMERWYGVSIRFDDPRLQDLQFTGTFEKETIQQALDALKLTAQFDYSIEGTQITIHD